MDQDQQPTAAAQPAGPVKISPDKMYQAERRKSVNLMNPVKIAPAGSPSEFWRAAVLDVLAVATAAAFGYSFAQYLAGGLSFWFIIGALMFWGMLSALEGFLQKSASRRSFVIVLESAALLAFFYTSAWTALALAGILVLVFLLSGYFSARRELANTIEIRFFAASGRAIGKVVTAAVIFMVVMYASATTGSGSFFVSEHAFGIFYNWASGFVNNFYPSVPLSGTFGDFAHGVARAEAEKNPAFRNLPQQQQNAAIDQAAAEITNAFAPAASGGAASGTVAAPPPSSEPASSVFYRYFSAKAAVLQNRFNDFFIAAWGLALFLILRGLGIIVVWASELVSFLFYELLLAAGFMKIREETTTKEIVTY